MNTLASYIAKTLYTNHIITEDMLPVYRYLFAYILEELLFDCIAILSALLSGHLLAGICYLLVSIPIRQFAGGVHASTALRCTILSYGSYFLYLYTCSALSFYIRDTWILFYCACAIIILAFAPVDTKNKRLNHLQKKKLHRLCMVSVIFHSILILVMWYNGVVSYCTSVTICFAICTVSIILGKIKNRKEQANAV